MIDINYVIEFAKDAHTHQTRKYTTGLPYFVHLQNVADLVRSVTDDQEMIAAAYLHDTVEDTEITHGDIYREFGERVCNLVFWLTDVSKPYDGNRKIRKTLDRWHLSKAPEDAVTIKYADLIDNTQSIMALDPDFAKVYLKEKEELLQVMVGGSPILREKALRNVLFNS